jgi:hypothetical protein
MTEPALDKAERDAGLKGTDTKGMTETARARLTAGYPALVHDLAD